MLTSLPLFQIIRYSFSSWTVYIDIINTNDEPDLGVLTKQINFEKQFIFRRSINDIQMYVIQKWEEVGA